MLFDEHHRWNIMMWFWGHSPSFHGSSQPTWFLSINKWPHSPSNILASLSNQTSLKYSQVWREGKGVPPKPHHDVSSMVLIKQHCRWLYQTHTFPMHPHRYDNQVVHWSTTSQVPRFQLPGFHVLAIFPTTRQIWRRDGDLVIFPPKYYDPHN